MLLVYFLTLVLLLIVVLYYLSVRKFDYWQKRKVPHLKPIPLLGNYGQFILLKKSVGVVVKKICDQFPEEPYIGAYFGTESALIVQDPELLRLVLVKDFYYFNGREASAYFEKEPLTKSVFFVSGDQWRVTRQHLTPMFTSAKMKNMFPLIEKCSHVFEDLLKDETSVSDVLETNSLVSRYTMDCVGSCSFGVETNVMQKNFKRNPFKIVGDMIFEQSTIRGIKNIFRSIWPRQFYALGLVSFPMDITDFLLNLLTAVFEKRNYKPSSRNDFVDQVLGCSNSKYITGDSIANLKTGGSEKVQIEVDNNFLVGQSLSFFGAGFETSATVFCLTLFELAKNKNVQELAIKEVDDYLIKHDHKVEYECIKQLPYLEACMDEAMRMYPVFTNLTREVMEDYTFPTGLKVEKGMRIHIPVQTLHYNAKYFPEPEVFRPERFLPDENNKITPYTYMPFGEGPRICIGARFAKMQIIIGLVTILKKYKVSLADGMSSKVTFDPRTIVSHTAEGVFLKYTSRK